MRNLPQVIQAKALTDSVLRVAKQPGPLEHTHAGRTEKRLSTS